MATIIPTNQYQTPITEELLKQYPDEVVEDKRYTVYRHISPSGKVYVGITKLPVRYRWKQYGIGYQNCKLFFKAILKYGWDNIVHEIVLSDISKSEAIYAEKYLIKWYKMHGISYNTADGGEGSEGFIMPDEAKYQISKRLKEIRGRAVLQYSANGEFIEEDKSAREASIKLGYGRTSVSDCAARQNGRNTLHGFIFIYKDNIDTLEQRLDLCRKQCGNRIAGRLSDVG